MANSEGKVETARKTSARIDAIAGQLSPEHYLRLILHRKWIVIGVFFSISIGTFLYARRMPDIYTSETLILVDPQKVPESYVKSTVTGDVRNRLGTLSQQILSATRLQKIIDTFNLYPEERKTQAREDVIAKMRSNIHAAIANDFGGSQDLQAFRISYSGRDPRLVAEVANSLAGLFIDENLKAREQQATGTAEFLQSQLEETRKALEQQEAKLKDFRLRHVGEMPEQETADLQILGQLQAQLQSENDALSRAQQQKSIIQSMMAQGTPMAVDLDGGEQRTVKSPGADSQAPQAAQPPINSLRTRLAALKARGYTENHPDVRKLKAQIEEEETKTEAAAVEQPKATEPAQPEDPPAAPAPASKPAPILAFNPAGHVNPVLQSQLKEIDAEIAKRRQEQQRLSKSVAAYRSKVEAIPVNQQQITELVRDYEISKEHYSQLLEKQLSAQTATQMEIRQKGEKFEILDPAVPAERPSQPNRKLINAAGSAVGLALGLLVAVATEFLGISITEPKDISAATGLQVLEVIPVIQTYTDRLFRRRRIIVAAASAAVAVAVCTAIYFCRKQLAGF
jgi:polysaccharide chain length determinant protein (PEP-CTERM system associated)